MELFGSNLNSIAIVQELIGTKVIWPAMNVYTLQTLTPGKAYKIKTFNPINLTFPTCTGKENYKAVKQANTISTPFGNLNMTPSSQLVSFLAGSLDNFDDGDLIYAESKSSVLGGFIEINKTSQNQVMTLFGDDSSTPENEGFTENEVIKYRVFRAAAGNEVDVNITFDSAFDNATGNFRNNSLAAIIDVDLQLQITENNGNGNVMMFPNPAKDMLYFSLEESLNEPVSVTIFDIQGRLMVQEVFAKRLEMNISRFLKGTYYVKIQTNAATEIKKLIVL
jgi:hypothetical protein